MSVPPPRLGSPACLAPTAAPPTSCARSRITRGWLDHAEGSVLVEFGRTRVLCAASFTEGVPRWRKGSGLGWVTAEYAMLPALDQHPQRPRVGQGPDRRSHPRDLPADRAGRCAPSSTTRRSARTPSCSTATCCRPTAAPAPRRSPAPTSRSPTRWPGRGAGAGQGRRRAADRVGRGGVASASSTASRCSTCATRRTSGPRPT